MPTYSHSGSLGDLIYSLPVVKYFGKGNFYVKLHSVNYVGRKYGYNVPQIVRDYHTETLTQADFKMLLPLLEAQPYISKVIATENKEEAVDYDLDSFRAVMWRSFHGSFVEGYFRTFNVPYTPQDIVTPWLSASPKKIAKVIVSRTFRYRNPDSEIFWKQILALPTFTSDAVFIGLPEEHADFEKTFEVKISHYKCKDFLDMAEVIAGSETVMSNGTFTYSLAQGLGKSTYLETIKEKAGNALPLNECYFNRPNCFYF